jgi:Right handed beta helix region
VTGLKIDVSTTQNGATCAPTGLPRAQTAAILGANVLVDRNEITASNRAESSNGFYLGGDNAEIAYNRIHDVGDCLAYDHGLYVGSGSGTQIHHNWIYNTQKGWGVQIYPSPSAVHAYANVIDTAGSGFVECSTGSNNLIEHNVVSNSTGGGNMGPGALISGCGPQGSSTNNVVNENDQFNNPAGYGNCANPPPNLTCTGSISVDPLFVRRANHNYTVQARELATWGLWGW